MDDRLERRYVDQTEKMDKVFASISMDTTDQARDFMDMAHNYYKDSDYFFKKGDKIRAFEAIVISWSYIDAGLKLGMFSLPDELRGYFTA